MVLLVQFLILLNQDKDAIGFFSCIYYEKIVSLNNKYLYNKINNFDIIVTISMLLKIYNEVNI